MEASFELNDMGVIKVKREDVEIERLRPRQHKGVSGATERGHGKA